MHTLLHSGIEIAASDAAACLRLLHCPQLAADTAEQLVNIFVSGRFACERSFTVDRYREAVAAGTANPPLPRVPSELSAVDVGAAKALTALAVECTTDLLQMLGLSASPYGLWTLLAATKAALQLQSSARGRGSSGWLRDPTCVQIDRVGASWFAGKSAFELHRNCGTATATRIVEKGDAPRSSTSLLVIVFSSLGRGLARPEWGSTLDALGIPHDRLQVVDTTQSWFQQTSDGLWGDEGKALESRIEAIIASERGTADANAPHTGYDRIVMIGHSMGATAALLCARMGTAVVAFCPQVDVATCPQLVREEQLWGEDDTLELLQARLCRNVRDAHNSGVRIDIHVGTLPEDVRQSALVSSSALPDHCKHSYPLESHDLPAWLQKTQELGPILASVINRDHDALAR
eukprot:SAG31_NODE_56_length_29726_cov_41.443312_21_plen_405_part_00